MLTACLTPSDLQISMSDSDINMQECIAMVRSCYTLPGNVLLILQYNFPVQSIVDAQPRTQAFPVFNILCLVFQHLNSKNRVKR